MVSDEQISLILWLKGSGIFEESKAFLSYSLNKRYLLTELWFKGYLLLSENRIINFVVDGDLSQLLQSFYSFEFIKCEPETYF